jgi:hypothetical protein
VLSSAGEVCKYEANVTRQGDIDDVLSCSLISQGRQPSHYITLHLIQVIKIRFMSRSFFSPNVSHLN